MMFPRYVIAGTALFISAIAFLNLSGPDQAGWRFIAKLTALLSALGTLGTWGLVSALGTRKAKTVCCNLMLFGVSFGVCLVAGEYVVRYAFRDVTTTIDYKSYFSYRWERSHPASLNRHGFREREFSRDKADGVYRIAIIGDSFTFGQGIDIGDRFSNILQQQLDTAPGKYEVLNFGLAGAETIDEIEILRNTVIDIAPDFVLLQWFVNDVEGHDRGDEQRPWPLVPSERLTGWLQKHSALYYLNNDMWKRLQVQLGLLQHHDDYIINRFRDPDSGPSRAGTAALEAFFDLAGTHSIPVGVVLFPRLLDVAGSVDSYPFGFLIDRALDTCDLYEVPCLDMRPVFAGVSPAKTLWANRLDPHPGPIANALAADAILGKFGERWSSARSRRLP